MELELASGLARHNFRQSRAWLKSAFESSRSLHWASFAAFYAIVSNVPYWAASRWIGLLPLGWFCLEYAACGVIALFVPGKTAAALLFALIVMDLTCGVSKTYYLAPTDCFKSLGYVHELSATRLIAVVVVGILTLVVISIAALFLSAPLRGEGRRCAAACLLAFAAIVASSDLITVVRESGHLPNALHWLTGATFVDSNRSSEYQRLWASRYPLVRLVRNESLYGWTPIEFGSLADYSSVPSATGQALELSGIEENRDPREMPNLVVIVVESWGIETDPNIANALTQPYLQPELLSQYRVVQGEVRFYGSTVAAEARELCGRKFGPQIESASSQDLQGCVPGRLAALGYSSVGLHGMDQEMFRRKIWYRSLGFQEEWFRDRFRQQELPDCPGAFVGTCDAAVADWMAHRLTTASDRPDFVYWMTLNSHLPVPIPSGTAPEPSCVLSPLPAQPPSFCSWYRLVANVHSSVARLALTKLSRPTIFVIVGDHAPPFSNSVLRNEFSDTDVPYVILLPKSIALRNQAARRENSGDSHIDR